MGLSFPHTPACAAPGWHSWHGARVLHGASPAFAAFASLGFLDLLPLSPKAHSYGAREGIPAETGIWLRGWTDRKSCTQLESISGEELSTKWGSAFMGRKPSPKGLNGL